MLHSPLHVLQWCPVCVYFKSKQCHAETVPKNHFFKHKSLLSKVTNSRISFNTQDCVDSSYCQSGSSRDVNIPTNSFIQKQTSSVDINLTKHYFDMLHTVCSLGLLRVNVMVQFLAHNNEPTVNPLLSTLGAYLFQKILNFFLKSRYGGLIWDGGGGGLIWFSKDDGISSP